MKILRRRFFLLSLILACTSARAASPVMNSATDTYVLVHGAWGGGWSFKEVDRLLRAEGHTAYRPTLTGQGERVHLANPEITLTTHITDIVNLILWEDLRDLVLVGHSYGGAVITGVIDRVPDRIKRVVYLDAGILNDGESLRDAFGGNMPASVDGGFLVPAWVKAGQALPHDVPHPAKTLTEPIKLINQAAAQKVPTTYVLFVAPNTAKEKARFFPFYLRAKARGWTLRELSSDHNAQTSQPKQLVALLKHTSQDQNQPATPASSR